MKLNLDTIEAAARAATPGPWKALHDGNQYVKTTYLPTAECVPASRIVPLVRPWNPHAYIAHGFKPTEFETARFLDADAHFIATANPETVLALVERIRELEAACVDQQRGLDRHHLATCFVEGICAECHAAIRRRDARADAALTRPDSGTEGKP